MYGITVKHAIKILLTRVDYCYPLQRSAFTHSDNYISSRLDFAKERYGGPITTELIENVKTFLRIVIVLFSIGPVFSLEVLDSYFIFLMFGFDLLQHNPAAN